MRKVAGEVSESKEYGRIKDDKFELADDLNIIQFCENLKTTIKDAYESGTTMVEAEKLAGRFLHAMLHIAEELRVSDLDARMRKTGVKAIKAAVYLQNAQASDKKPSDKMLEAMVDQDKLVGSQQEGYDTAEVHKNYLQSVYDVCKEAHVFMRGIAKQQG